MVLASLLSGLPAQAAPATVPTSPPLTWTECPPDPFGTPVDPRLRCTTLKAPLDYRAPRGATIDIAVSRMRTAKPGLRRGILLHNAGGPGGASLNLPSSYVHVYPQDILDRYDLVSFDPRGVGYSSPVTCGRTWDQLPNEVYLPFPAPDGSIDANVTFARDLARDCLAEGGREIRYVTTANTARDMDRIRVALGESKVSYNSGSYGSYLGAVYATMFPERTDRFVIDSNVDPGGIWQDQWRMWDPGAELRFTDFAKWAVAQDPALGATPDKVRTNFLALADRLDRAPVTHPKAGQVNGNLFRAAYRGYSYNVVFFPEIAAWWHFVEGTGPAPDWFDFPVLPGIPADNEVAVQVAVTCGDIGSPRRIDQYRREVREDRAKYPILAGMGANVRACAFWPDPVEPPVRVTDRGPDNILILQNLRDPATPYAGALGMRRALGHRARMITVDAGNHGVYDPSTPSCAVTETDRFLTTGALPRRDLFCKPDPAPPVRNDTLARITLAASGVSLSDIG